MRSFYKNIIFLICILMVVDAIPLFAQNDTLKDEYQKEFDSFLNDSQQEFVSFKSKNDSVFYNFLKKSWKEFHLMEMERPEIPKPDEQPILKGAAKNKSYKIEPATPHKTILEDAGKQIRYNNVPEKYDKLDYISEYAEVDFYGTTINFPVLEIKKTSGKIVNKEQIATFFKENANDETLLNTISFLKESVLQKKFNSYAYLMLLKKTASNYFDNLNDQVLFVWFGLIKTGYDAKVAYNDNGVFLLVNFDVPVYSIPYLVNDGTKYYLIPFSGQTLKNQQVSSYPELYSENNQSVSLVLKELPDVTKDIKQRIIHYHGQNIPLVYNQNLINFYSSYPECELPVYFIPDLSQAAINSLSKYLSPKLDNKTTIEQVNLLLDFLQKGFPYETDNKQFGREKYLFAEESIAFPYSDCEDRAILLSHLIKHYTGLKTIGLAFPEHVSLAVALKDSIQGNYVEYNGLKYYICDPTYIGSKLGMIMPELATSHPEIIDSY